VDPKSRDSDLGTMRVRVRPDVHHPFEVSALTSLAICSEVTRWSCCPLGRSTSQSSHCIGTGASEWSDWREMGPGDDGHLAYKLGIAAELERPGSMRLEASCPPARRSRH